MTEIQQERQKAILKILNYLQAGGDLATAKQMFQKSFDQVDVAEITAAERELIAQGLDPREIQYLCDVHVDLFKDKLKKPEEPAEFSQPGHPVQTIKTENLVLKSLVNDALLPDLKKWQAGESAALTKIRQELDDLSQVKKHYARKETSLFPIMTRHGITAPPQVMWGVDDDILALIKKAQELAAAALPDAGALKAAIEKAGQEVLAMIVKEEDIMLPMLAEVATPQEWGYVKEEEKQFGYCLIQKPINWRPPKAAATAEDVEVKNLRALAIKFSEGSLDLAQLRAIMDLLPMSLTFVDADDKVAFFGGRERNFSHSHNAIGNNVYSCHPQEVISKVKAILTALRQGEQDQFEFVVNKNPLQLLWTRYLAIRSPEGQYLGCLEIVQNLAGIQAKLPH